MNKWKCSKTQFLRVMKCCRIFHRIGKDITPTPGPTAVTHMQRNCVTHNVSLMIGKEWHVKTDLVIPKLTPQELFKSSLSHRSVKISCISGNLILHKIGVSQIVYDLTQSFLDAVKPFMTYLLPQ